LTQQVRKYYSTLTKCLKAKIPNLQHLVEIICILGSPPEPQDEMEENIKQLDAAHARYITYDELIQQTRDSYRDYLETNKKIGRIQKLIESI
jgi:hypothetical protein